MCSFPRERTRGRKGFAVHPIDVEDAIKVVDLMLDDPRGPASQLKRILLIAVLIEPAEFPGL